jgi:threonine aldolase
MNTFPPFRSDNTAGACLAVLEAITRTNGGLASAYGTDDHSAALNRAMSDAFEHRCWCFPVGTGTAANALALAAVAQANTLIACHTGAHILRSEDEAVRFFSPGVGLEPLPGEAGRIAIAILEDAAHEKRNSAPPRWSALSLTQLTETGTVYSLDETAALATAARRYGARVHMDGARFANAVVALGATPADASWRSGVDILSFGGTKNGTINADAVVAFDETIASAVRARLKRTGQLYSKMRFMAAQLLALLEDGLWLKNAEHANAMAQRLNEGISACRGVEILHAVDGNHLILRLAKPLVRRLTEVGSIPWKSGADEQGHPIYRLVTSFDTEPEEVDRFAVLLKLLSSEQETGQHRT